MVSKFTNQPTNKEVVEKVNDIIDNIPTVNNATLTIQRNGSTVKTFTANASTDVTCNIGVPTKTSQITNDSGFVTTDTKNTTGGNDTSSKIYLVGMTSQTSGSGGNNVTYTHDTAFVDTSGQLNSANPAANTNNTIVATTKWVTDKGYTTNIGTVTSVNSVLPNNAGNVSLTIPTKTSDLNNDSGFQANVIETIKVNNVAQTVTSKTVNITVPSAVTESTVSGWGFTKNTGTVTSVNSTGPDSNGNVSITIPTVPTNVSAFTNDSNYIANTATGTNSLTISGTATTATGAVNIGLSSQTTGGYGSAFGYASKAKGSRSVALGWSSNATGADSIQLGYGTNSTGKTLSVGFYNLSNYTLLDGTTGLIPSARIPIDGSTITVNSNGQLQSAGGSGAANTDLSNLSATGKAVIDGQWTWKYLSVATNTAANSYQHDLASYLPNDNYSYEIYLTIACYYKSANASFSVGTVASPNTNKTSSGNYHVFQYVSSYARGGYCSAILPVGTSRKIYSQITALLDNSSIELYGYRRIGTNT